MVFCLSSPIWILYFGFWEWEHKAWCVGRLGCFGRKWRSYNHNQIQCMKNNSLHILNNIHLYIKLYNVYCKTSYYLLYPFYLLPDLPEISKMKKFNDIESLTTEIINKFGSIIWSFYPKVLYTKSLKIIITSTGTSSYKIN